MKISLALAPFLLVASSALAGQSGGVVGLVTTDESLEATSEQPEIIGLHQDAQLVSQDRFGEANAFSLDFQHRTVVFKDGATLTFEALKQAAAALR